MESTKVRNIIMKEKIKNSHELVVNEWNYFDGIENIKQKKTPNLSTVLFVTLNEKGKL